MKTRCLSLVTLPALMLVCFCFCSKPTQSDEPIVPEDPEDTTIIIPVTPEDTIPVPIITDSTKATVTFLEDGNVLVINPAPELISTTFENGVLSISSVAEDMGFELSGTASNVSICLYTLYPATVILDELSLTSATGTDLINIESEERCILQINDSTSNVLTDTGTDADSTKACIYSTGALAVTGKGKLEINTSHHHGINCPGGISILDGEISLSTGKDAIHCHDHISIDGGKVSITSGDDGLQVKDGYISISDGEIDIQSVNDGMTATFDEDASSTPFINISGGVTSIITSGDKGMGIDAETNLYINGGVHSVTVNGAASKALKCGGDMSVSDGEVLLQVNGGVLYDETEEDLSSAAGIKCDGKLIVEGGNTNLEVYCKGDGAKGLNVEGNITINSGQVYVESTGNIASMMDSTSSPKAIKCDKTIFVQGGDIYAQSNHSHAMEAAGNICLYSGTVCCKGGAEDKKCGLKADGYLLIANSDGLPSPVVMAFGNKNTKPTTAQKSQCCLSLTDKVNSYPAEANVNLSNGETSIFDCTLPFAYNQGRMHLIYSSPALSTESGTYSFMLSGRKLTDFTISGTLTEVKIK